MLLLVFALAAGGANAAAPAAATGAVAALAKQRKEIALGFATHASKCVQRHDTEHVAFHGCIDWHSATHGVWTLVAYTHATGDKRFEPIVKSLLTKENLAQEAQLLAGNDDFENPYGRAWLLRLAREYERHYHDPRMRAIAQVAADSLLSRYTDFPPEPDAPEYRNPAWAMVNLIEWYDFAGDARKAAMARAIVRESFVDRKLRCNAARDRRGFMSVCTTWAWAVSKTMSRAEFGKWALAFIPPASLPAPVDDARNAHEYGLNFSRAWGLWQLATLTGRAEYYDSYAAHVRATWSHPDSWRGDYYQVGHWVPQFGMLAIQPLFGDR